MIYMIQTLESPDPALPRIGSVIYIVSQERQRYKSLFALEGLNRVYLHRFAGLQNDGDYNS